MVGNSKNCGLSGFQHITNVFQHHSLLRLMQFICAGNYDAAKFQIAIDNKLGKNDKTFMGEN